MTNTLLFIYRIGRPQLYARISPISQQCRRSKQGLTKTYCRLLSSAVQSWDLLQHVLDTVCTCAPWQLNLNANTLERGAFFAYAWTSLPHKFKQITSGRLFNRLEQAVEATAAQFPSGVVKRMKQPGADAMAEWELAGESTDTHFNNTTIHVPGLTKETFLLSR